MTAEENKNEKRREKKRAELPNPPGCCVTIDADGNEIMVCDVTWKPTKPTTPSTENEKSDK